MPERGVPLVSHEDLLTFEEIERVVRVGVALGVRAVRLTGGEPLMRRGIVSLVKRLASIEGLDDLSMTTNGVLLAEYAAQLKAAGLRRVNVSLDSLDPGTFAAITRGGDLGEVLGGIRAALSAGLAPVKVNCVPLKGLNDREIPALVSMAGTLPIHLRFIELMPVGCDGAWFRDRFVPAAEVQSVVEEVVRRSGARLSPSAPRPGGGPAACFEIDGYRGTIGFIPAVTGHFCGWCTRMRLTSTGGLRPCLASDTEVDVKGALRGGCDNSRLAALLMEAARLKPWRRGMEYGASDERRMSRIGG
jgi:cyclic pyranopterin phosphate synthase